MLHQTVKITAKRAGLALVCAATLNACGSNSDSIGPPTLAAETQMELNNDDTVLLDSVNPQPIGGDAVNDDLAKDTAILSPPFSLPKPA